MPRRREYVRAPLDLVSPLTGQPNDVFETQGRRQHRGRLCRYGGRPGRGPYHQEKSESKTRETVHDVTVCLIPFPPGRRRRRPGRRRQRYRPTPASCLYISAAMAASLAASRDKPARRSLHGSLRDSRAAVRLRQRDMLVGLGGVSLGQCQEVLLEPSVLRGRVVFRRESIQLLLCGFRCAGSALESGCVTRRSGRGMIR